MIKHKTLKYRNKQLKISSNSIISLIVQLHMQRDLLEYIGNYYIEKIKNKSTMNCLKQRQF